MTIKVRLIAKKASILGKDMVEVKKELKVVDNIVKTDKVVKAKNELKQLVNISKVGEINPWILKK
jgi:hypothetical protein